MELSGELEVDLSGFPLQLAGASPELAARLRRDWAAFLATAAAEPFLRCELDTLDTDLPGAPFEPKRMRSSFADSRAVFEMPQGRAEVSSYGRATIQLARGLGLQEYWTAMNLLRACLAWRLPERSAALVHAAGLVLDGRGFILVGAEGTGKSSWARLGQAGGARVISDDLVLCDAARDPVELCGAPFRSTHTSDYRPGRWPLAAVLFPRHGAAAALTPVPALHARGRILANLPFVGDAVGDERIGSVVDRLATRVQCLELTFALDGAFLELLGALE